ncbi:hypothetical protein QQX98_009712 [Neonectria punicea]|uniref:Uncharacterized protein n=1 Tax=Neonectria punicea TaxID=979145 RepID=A0ABR1GRH9_9HYPO
MVFFADLIRWVRGLFRHKKVLLPVLVLLGIFVSGLWCQFFAPRHSQSPSPDHVIVANFKREEFSKIQRLLLPVVLYCEEKWYRSLYQVLGVHARGENNDIMEAYQKITEAANVNKRIEERASCDIIGLSRLDERLLSFQSTFLILINATERGLYDDEFYDKVGFINSDREEQAMSWRHEDMRQGELESKGMRKIQADIDKRLRDVCKDYF